MAITIIAVGKLKEDYWRAAEAEYAKRLQKEGIKIIEVAEERLPAAPSEAQIAEAKLKEGERLLNALPKDCFVFVLDGRGQNISSEQLAERIAQAELDGRGHFAFIIGGSYGLPPQVLQRADFLLSFGKMTYPHQLMRIILLEQVYRAYKIKRGEPYHK